MPDNPDETREAVVLVRTLPVAPEQVWPLWTEPAHFESWYGPAGAVVTVHAMDVQVGGDRRVSMAVMTPAGQREMHFAGTHLVVETPRRLSYTEAVVEAAGSDPHGGSTEVRLELEPAETGTRLTLTHLGIPPGSPGEGGWVMALDKLGQIAAGLSRPD